MTSTATLWADFAAPLKAFLTRRLPPGVDADDVRQEVFLRLQEHLPSLAQVERLDAWIYRIARNAITDSLRGKRRRLSFEERLALEERVAEELAPESTAAAELAPCLTSLIARLDEPYRAALQMTELEGLTQAAAAKRLGVSSSGMKSRVQRARAQLQALLVRCCRVELDARGGIVGYTPRATCG